MYWTCISDTNKNFWSHNIHNKEQRRAKSGKMNAVCNKVQQLGNDIMNVGNYVVREWHNKMSIEEREKKSNKANNSPEEKASIGNEAD